MIKPFLSSVQAGRGIQDFMVICDESNNTPDVIARNQLVVDCNKFTLKFFNCLG